MHGVRERHVFDERKPSVMLCLDYVRRRHVCDRVRLDHDRSHVRILRGWHLCRDKQRPKLHGMDNLRFRNRTNGRGHRVVRCSLHGVSGGYLLPGRDDAANGVCKRHLGWRRKPNDPVHRVEHVSRGAERDDERFGHA